MFKHKLKILPLALVLLQAACGNGEDSNGASDAKDGTAPRVVPVETAVIHKGDVVDKVTATGTIFPVHDVLISSETAGTITRIGIEVGDRVQKGSLLVQVDEELKQLAVEQAKAHLLQARATFEKAVKDFERNKKVHSTRDISDYVFENARLQKKSAEAAFLAAQAQVKMAERQLRDARITSPISGIVAASLVELGAAVAPGTPVAKVVDISRVKIKFGVPEKDVVKVKKGQKAAISVDAYPDEVFQGTLSAVGPQADLATRTFPLEIVVENPQLRLKAGMMAKVEVAARTIQDVPLIPKSALLERSGRTLFFVVKDSHAEQRFPQLGLESGDKIALLSGARTGEEVVILGQENLGPGTRVEVKARHN